MSEGQVWIGIVLFSKNILDQVFMYIYMNVVTSLFSYKILYNIPITVNAKYHPNTHKISN